MTDSSMTISYLSRFVGDDSLLAPEDILPLYRLQQDAKFVSSQIPRLILVGEFKAGKSTLMNALLGGNHAATDVLEMTSWIARYWPSDIPFCRIICDDGKEIEVQSEDFKQKCQSRSFTQNELAQISRVDIGLPISTMTFSIIDCPGLGSVTRENERRMIDALQDADVIVWAVDVDSIGGMREGALLQKLLSHGMPYIIVLTKCDLISDSEIKEIKSYICDEFLIEPQNLFPTSADNALKEIKQGKQISTNTGIPQLNTFIRHNVSTRHAELRKQAELAHTTRVNEQAHLLVSKVLDELLNAKDALDRFKNISESMRKAVQGQLEMEVERMVRERMFADHRNAIVNDIETSLISGKGSLSQDSITAIFKKNLGEEYLDRFWQDISASMITSASQLWVDKLKDVQIELEEICQQFKSASWHEFTVSHSPEALALNISAISNETFSTALKTSFGIAGFATVYAAATAHFSLWAAATGVGIPIAAIGAVVSSALFYFQKNKSQNAAALEATGLVDSYVKHFIEDILRPHLFPQIAEININIQKHLVNGFENELKKRLPDASLDELLNEAQYLNYRLFARSGKKGQIEIYKTVNAPTKFCTEPTSFDENNESDKSETTAENESESASLFETLNQFIDDPSIPEDQKISIIIHATSLICAIVAAQPLPFADIFFLTPIQVIMVTAMSRVLGDPIDKNNPKEIVASVAAVVGWGVLAQQLILAGYKTIIPFFGALTTIPVVYAATFGLGCAARAVLEARRRDQSISDEEIRKIKEDAEEKAKAEKHDWSLDGMRKEFEELKQKAAEYEQYKDKLQQSEIERNQLQLEIERLLRKYDGAVSKSDLDDVLKENYAVREELNHVKPELEQLKVKIEAFTRKRTDILINRIRHCYPSITLETQAWRDIVELTEHRLNAFERQLGLLQHNPEKANFRDVIAGTRIREIGFDHDGRIYAKIEGNTVTIYRIGNKNSQDEDIKWVKQRCK